MAKYRLIEESSKTTEILREDMARIPLDERNRDYGEYLLWLEGKDADGNDMGKGKNIPDSAIVSIK